jgi:hypothetical protein
MGQGTTRVPFVERARSPAPHGGVEHLDLHELALARPRALQERIHDAAEGMEAGEEVAHGRPGLQGRAIGNRVAFTTPRIGWFVRSIAAPISVSSGTAPSRTVLDVWPRNGSPASPGPTSRFCARGVSATVYFRGPDENLVEFTVYDEGRRDVSQSAATIRSR